MSNFPNAAPPPGALFDNAPTVAPTWYARSDTSTLIPATRISQGRNGQWSNMLQQQQRQIDELVEYIADHSDGDEVSAEDLGLN